MNLKIKESLKTCFMASQQKNTKTKLGKTLTSSIFQSPPGVGIHHKRVGNNKTIQERFRKTIPQYRQQKMSSHATARAAVISRLTC